MKCFYCLQNLQNLLANGNSQIWTKIWWITNHTLWRTEKISPRTPSKIRQEFINLERNYHKELYWLCFIRWRGIWEEDIPITEVEELGKFGVIRKTFQKTEYERSLDNLKMKNLYFLQQMAQQNYQDETTNSKKPLWERISAENLMAIGKSFNLKKQKMTKESIRTFEFTQKVGKNFICRHHIEPRSSIACAEKESYLIPLSYWCQLGCRREHKSVRFVDEFHKIYVFGWNSS